MKVGLVAAVANNGAIGRNNRLPWHLPNDLKLFRRLTTGHAVIMGRKTAESIGRPLPNRRNAVVTSHLSLNGFDETYPSLERAIAALRSEVSCAFVIGGAALFHEALFRNLVDDLHYTSVQADVDGDVFFPPVHWNRFELVEEQYYPLDDFHVYAFTYRHYRKKAS